MPIYEYECVSCSRVEEALQKFSDAPLTTCKHCSGKLQRLISQSSFHLKGSGWYVTDYTKKTSEPPKAAPASDKPSTPKEKSSTSQKSKSE